MITSLLDRPVVRYLLTGGISYALELGVLLLLHLVVGLSVGWATAIAFWVGLAFSFLGQKLFAFKDYQKTLRTLSKQIGAYLLLVLFNYGFTLFVVNIFDEKYIVLSRTLALVITTVWNYYLYKILFSQKNRTAAIADIKSLSDRLLSERTLKSTYVIVAALAVLALCTAYGAIKASYYMANDADALVNTYLLDGNSLSKEIRLQPEHTNLIKFPLFALHSVFPYHYTSFVAINTLLSLATTLGFALIAIRLFGRKYAALVALTLASLVAGSVALNLQYVWTTVRNVDFVIALGFIVAVAWFASKIHAITRRDWIVFSLITLLYGLLIASDMFYLYTVSLPVLIFLVFYQPKTAGNKKRLFIALGALIVTTIIGYALPLLLEAVHYVTLNSSSAFGRVIVEYDKFLPSLQVAFRQYLELGGGLIFGELAKLSRLAVFVNFALLTAAVLASIQIIRKKVPTETPRLSLREDQSAFVLIALTFLSVFFVYILSGQVIQVLADGSFASAQQRYVTFMVFLAALLFVWFLRYYYAKKVKALFLVGLILLCSIGVSALRAPALWAPTEAAASERRNYYLQLSDILRKNDIDTMLSGYWSSATTRFWSGDTVKSAPLQNCNYPFNFLSREDWYIPQENVRTALVIERAGPNAYFWKPCSDEKLLVIYGTPSKVIQRDNSTYIWLYDYDIRSKLQHHPTP